MQLATGVALKLGGRRFDRQVNHPVDDGAVIPPVAGIASRHQLLANMPGVQRIGSVGNHLARPGPVLAVGLDGLAGGRKHRVVDGHIRQVGDRLVQGHLEGEVVDSAHTQRIRCLFPCDDLAGIGHPGRLDVIRIV